MRAVNMMNIHNLNTILYCHALCYNFIKMLSAYSKLKTITFEGLEHSPNCV
jgi:hypothetical protein